jgi:hypothetical protein
MPYIYAASTLLQCGLVLALIFRLSHLRKRVGDLESSRLIERRLEAFGGHREPIYGHLKAGIEG